MTTERPQRLSRHESEELLAGRLGHHPLHAVLHAAGAPADPSQEYELVGERDAVAQFRAARAPRAITPGRPSMLRSWLARLAAAKVLAGAAATTVVCGVALAASTGTLPGPLAPAQQRTVAAGQVTTTATIHPTRSPDDDATGSADGDGRTSGHPSGTRTWTARPTEMPREIPAAALRGLCRIWLVLPSQQRSRLAQLRPFAALITKAGGTGAVDAYCVALVGKPPVVPPGSCIRLPHWPLPVGRVAPDHVGALDEAPGWPTTVPTSWPTAWPTTWPHLVLMRCPVMPIHPTGRPTGVPSRTAGPVPTRSWPFPTGSPSRTIPTLHG